MAKERFHPFWSLKAFNGLPDESGINWSYGKFTNQDDRRRYVEACKANGYRTRNEGEKDGFFYVQYHHYED